MKEDEIKECITLLTETLAGLVRSVVSLESTTCDLQEAVKELQIAMGNWHAEYQQSRQSENESHDRTGDRLRKHAERLKRLESSAGIEHIEGEQAERPLGTR